MQRLFHFVLAREGLVIGALAAVTSVAAGSALALGHGMKVLIAALVVPTSIAFLVGIQRFAASPAILAYWCVAAAIALMPLNGLRASPSATYSDLLILVSLPLVAFALLLRSRLPRLPAWLFAGGALIIASAAIVELFPVPTPDAAIFRNLNLTTGEEQPDSNLLLATRLIFALCVVPLVVGLALTSWAQLRTLSNLWVVGVAASSLVAVLAYGGIDLQESLTGTAYSAAFVRTDRFVGLTVHPGALGLTAAMAVPLVLTRMSSPGQVVRYAPLLALFVAGVLVSGSRIALLSIAVAGLLIIVWKQRARYQVLAIAAIGLAVAMAATGDSSFSTIERVTGRSVTASSSDTLHLSNLSDGLHYFLERPATGYGFTAVRGAHNIVLQLLTSGGILALAGFALIIAGLFRIGWMLRSRLPADQQSDVLGPVVSVAVFLFIGMVGNQIFDRYLYVPAALLLGAQFLVARKLTSSAPLPTRGSDEPSGERPSATVAPYRRQRAASTPFGSLPPEPRGSR